MSRYTVAVRALAEFTAKSGDLDLRFTPSPTAQEGIAGHTTVTGRRGESYQREVPLAGDYRHLHVRGRADGYDPRRNRLEEIKTFRGDLERQPANHRVLHWAQLKIYGALLCRERGLDQVELALVYFDVVKQKETPLREVHEAESLNRFFDEHCERFLQWADRELAHRQARDQALTALAFPHARFRSGQRELAESVYQSACTGRPLLAQAPTGIGKTLGTLFPLLKAAPGRVLDKVFFLSAKTPGRKLALDAVRTLTGDGTMPLRTVEMIAREKSCEHPDKACHGESCPLAAGFYDRLPAARQAAVESPILDRRQLREVALRHHICPYYLSQEMARWSDVVVGDYNYYFDLSALLHGLTTENQWRVAVLADEAHNLVDRARGMYSAELDQIAFRRLKKQVPKSLKGAFERIHRHWNALNKEIEEAQPDTDYRVHDDPPQGFLFALQQGVAAITDYLAEQPEALDSDLIRFYFDALHFNRVAERFDSDAFLFDSHWRAPSRGRPGSFLCLRNVVPAALLAPRFETASAAVLFSATLSPPRYYADLLGLPDTTAWVDVPSPFRAEQLQVRIGHRISTRYRDRRASLAPIAALIGDQFQQRRGNYLAFFSSYEYLEGVLSVFRRAHPDVPVWSQQRRMDEEARQAFLDRFEEGGEGIGFAVLGGAFAEGIDLPGRRLIGAFVATLGLPQMNPVNEQFKTRLAALFGDGYDYTYLFPGLRKVVQAAGRVIRTGDDEGVVHLIDDRFAHPRVRALLPSWWQCG
ncbi:helicase C-terminal domain-containing protein [Alloalcanivorax xenomutans]|uniref:helicase C-terminal domain-containing protein n=1 Tax=Alloalcanivorax xenomutans TaxID=1094342 RepID=UPI0029344624|nr:helicase C-terminal domain-containing protein [Alloalcanivorax xenomutans]WOD29711.1 helicase C-terminal domain-containing protein [Alloalcanivorax xenomutans]